MENDDKKPYNLRPRDKRKRRDTEDDDSMPVIIIPMNINREEEDMNDKQDSRKRPIILKTEEEREFFHKCEKWRQREYAENMRQVLALTPSTPLRFHILGSNLTPSYKKMALSRLDALQSMNSRDSEYTKLKQWVDGLMMIPFGKYEELPVSFAKDGHEKCKLFLEKSLKTLDSAIYGMPEAKSQILQVLGQWITNPSSAGQVLAFQGPMGCGKTSFVKEGIARILNRPFFFVPLGGASDASFFKGHSYTYEGSQWGKIADILMKARCMNPIIYFDELDKVSNTEVGKEIIGILTHITDKSQNSHFHDRYFNDIDLDLSKVLFVFSYNDDSLLNPILRDRLTVIRIKGYNQKTKKEIAKHHILPNLLTQYGFKTEDIVFTDDILEHITEVYSKNEGGIRDMIRAFEALISKLNLLRIATPESMGLLGMNVGQLNFPLTITKPMIELLLKLVSESKESMSVEVQRMYL